MQTSQNFNLMQYKMQAYKPTTVQANHIHAMGLERMEERQHKQIQRTTDRLTDILLTTLVTKKALDMKKLIHGSATSSFTRHLLTTFTTHSYKTNIVKM